MIETATPRVASPKAWQQLPAAFGWDDLVLPAAELEQLKVVAAEFTERFRSTAGAQPTLSRGRKRGILVLFCGPAGTGKTMAAQTLARELRLSVIEADLASVLVRDRWRIARLFAVAARSGSVLVFDHLETMLAGTKDADGSDPAGRTNDVSGLLERSAGHAGIVIFATRLPRVEADAVPAHFDHVIEFPLPGRAGREEIWRRQLANAGLGEADISALARALPISAGEIAACSVAVKQSSASTGARLTIDDVVRVLERESTPEPVTYSRKAALEGLRERMKADISDRSDRDGANTSDRSDRDGAVSDTRTEPKSRPPTTPQFRSQPGPGRSGAASASSAATSAAATVVSPAGQVAATGSTRGRRWMIAALAGIAAAAALGFALASPKNHSALPTLDRQATAGPALVSYPSSWYTRTAPAFPGAGLKHAVAFSPVGSAQRLLAVGTATARGPTLLPPGFVASPSTPAAGQMVRLGSTWFHRFPGLSRRGDPQPETVYALPTTAGVMLSVCLGPGDGFTGMCERILASLKLRPGVRALLTNPSYPRSLSNIIAKLNGVRVQASPQLAATRTANGQSSIESHLAHAAAQAAAAIASLNAGPARAANAALASALNSTARAYTAMARAASHYDAVAYRRASSSLVAAAAATDSAFAELKQFGYHFG